mgnify:CR=1 FL=1
MSVLIEIYKELREKYPDLSTTEIERITDAQFKVTTICINEYRMKDIKWMHLGKIRPSEYIKHREERNARQKAKLLPQA